MTLLSKQDLNDVLLCLTADRQAILFISNSEMGVVEEAEFVYKPDTLFKINEEFIKEAHSKGSKVHPFDSCYQSISLVMCPFNT